MSKAECIVCYDAIPNLRLLPCLHSVCDNCIEDLKKQAAANNQDYVSCLSCNERFDPAALSVNVVNREPDVDVPTEIYPLKCPTHAEQEVNAKDEHVFCVTCHSFVCSVCLASNQLIRRRSIMQKILMQPKKIVVASTHADHTLVNMAEACSILATGLKQIGDELEKRASDIEAANVELNEVLGGMKDRPQEIESDVSAICDVIVRQKGKNENRIKTIHDKWIATAKTILQTDAKTIENQREELVKLLDITVAAAHQASAMASMMTALKDKGEPNKLSEWVQNYNKVSERLKNLVETIPSLKAVTGSFLCFYMPIEPMCRNFNQLGFIQQARDYKAIKEPIATIGRPELSAPRPGTTSTNWKKPLKNPAAIAITFEGNIVIQQTSNTSPIFTATGQYINTIEAVEKPKPFCHTPIVGFSTTPVKARVDPESHQVKWTGAFTDLLVLEHLGTSVQIDSGANCLRVYSGNTTENLLRTIAEGQLSGPVCVAYNQANHLLVLEKELCRISIYTLHGRLLHQFGSKGTRPGQFENPIAVTCLGDGGIAVLDDGSVPCVHIF